MDEKQFKHLIEPRDRRREDPTKLKPKLTKKGAALAYNLHCLWCTEAAYYKTPLAYAKHKLCGIAPVRAETLPQLPEDWVSDMPPQVDCRVVERLDDSDLKIPIMPEPLRALLKGFPLALLDNNKWQAVLELIEGDGEVWLYVKEWFVNGMPGDPAPDTVPTVLLPWVRRVCGGELPARRSKKPALGIPDEVLSDVANQIHRRFGCGPRSADCIGALSGATGLAEDTIRKSLIDAGKGTSKASYLKKKLKRKT